MFRIYFFKNDNENGTLLSMVFLYTMYCAVLTIPLLESNGTWTVPLILLFCKPICGLLSWPHAVHSLYPREDGVQCPTILLFYASFFSLLETKIWICVKGYFFSSTKTPWFKTYFTTRSVSLLNLICHYIFTLRNLIGR